MDWVGIFSSALSDMIGPFAAIYALAAVGLNLHFGYTGLLNFGQVAFMLVGAYGVGVAVVTFSLSLWWGILVAILASVVVALILGIPTLRLRGDYLAIATIAAGEVLRLFFNSTYTEPVTNGAFGLGPTNNEFNAL
ncbi:MAG: branched-chain amino acid ABC transporter permease, partial [Microlunatus sp.]|nr:branched-chain amino acid ABC transporter permease [Microlunatus sp.]